MIREVRLITTRMGRDDPLMAFAGGGTEDPILAMQFAPPGGQLASPLITRI
jgi:hypothetical protein